MEELEEVKTELVPRNYQEKLIRIASKQNSIIYLPTGSGKTFIAVCVLKEFSQNAYARPYSQGGKISMMLVNTVTLVQQHTKYLERNTSFKIGSYSGEMQVDFWDKTKWLHEFETHQVLVMTAQICLNMITSHFLDLNNVNLMIFDECHQGVEAHTMRQIMIQFQAATEKPHVLGLTATLLNGNVKPKNVMDEVTNLETTYHAKVATVDELVNVIGYSTNPQEQIVIYATLNPTGLQIKIIAMLEAKVEILRKLKSPETKVKSINLPFLNEEKSFVKYARLLQDAVVHVNMLGLSGARIAVICYIIHLECEKKLCTENKSLIVINAIIATLVQIKELIDQEISSTKPEERLVKYSSPKVMKLLEILISYPDKSKEALCGIIFVQRKNTAKFLFHIVQEIAKVYRNLSYLNVNYIVGFNANPLNSTRECLYFSKVNKNILEMFKSKGINLLIASNVIEEGLNIPTCTMVVKFDTPTNYREYIQSKGRARHKTSLYYVMVDSENQGKFCNNYKNYKEIETNLNDYLIGKNEERDAPSSQEINQMYREIKPYYVQGPNSACITMLSSIPLLMRYCMSLPTDSYTVYEPNWYIEKHKEHCRVYIELPIISSIKEFIAGDILDNKKAAKRSAAFKACVLLYQNGELDQELNPVKKSVDDQTMDHLFRHWPLVKEVDAGATKKKRVYKRKVPMLIEGPLRPTTRLYLHIINLEPQFIADTIELDKLMLLKLYANNLCFGVLTSKPLPNLCKFPIFISAGEISIDLAVNAEMISLNDEELQSIKKFHYVIFQNVIRILKTFLVMNEDSKNMLLVPVLKAEKKINFDVIRKSKVNDCDRELDLETKIKLVVDEENYLGKIVTPYYRNEDKQYVVIQVCNHLSPASPFPNPDVQNYAEYYKEKYQINVINFEQPLLLVKAINSKLNYLKPRGVSQKRRREESFDDICLHLIPELCIKQDFPSSLWAQAKLLPTILHRIVQLLRAEELRSTIASEGNLGVIDGSNWKPLEVDVHLLNYETSFSNILKDKKKKKDSEELPVELNSAEVSSSLAEALSNKEFNNKIKESEYPWQTDEEPKDIERDLDTTQLDMDYYFQFIKKPLAENVHTLTPPPTSQLAIRYNPQYVYKPIKMLQNKLDAIGPQLCDLYQALMTAKCNDVVNMERLETLGDSFLKLAASLYVFLKYPTYTEGEATELKSRLISNRNLYYLANIKNLPGYIKVSELAPQSEWLPPLFCVPDCLRELILQKKFPVSHLFYVDLKEEEQLSGVIGIDTKVVIEEGCDADTSDETSFSSMCNYLGLHMVPDKTIADTAEALIGVYFQNSGFDGGVRFIEWLGLIPSSENLLGLMKNSVINPIVKPNSKTQDLEFLLAPWIANEIEEVIGYKFRNRAFLLQAVTHSSYTTNRITYSYERLEFIGDAVLDFLITTYIYESCGYLSPGDLTDLRSALVNNETFAAYTVKMGLHKYIKHYNFTLEYHISKFVTFQRNKDYAINDDVLILLNEQDLHMAENVDVPKVLGDLFESIAGAIYLDSGMDLETVWKVYYKIMWIEIENFAKNVPKNSVRLLGETLAPLYPVFHKLIELDDGKVMVNLDFRLNHKLTRVHGFGDNKKTAKKAAAKIALRLLTTKK